MGFKEIVLGIIFVGLFIMSMVTFGAQLSIDNNANNSILDDSRFSVLNESLRDNLRGWDDEANQSKQVFEEQNQKEGTDEFTLNPIPLMINLIGAMWGTLNIIVALFSDVLGIPALVLNLILSAVSLFTLLLAWRVIKAGGT